jgi:hypothetical protein
VSGLTNHLLFAIESLRKYLSLDRKDNDSNKYVVKPNTEKKPANFQVIFESNMPFGESSVVEEKIEKYDEEYEVLEIEPPISPIISK